MLKDSSGISDQRVCSERKWLRGFMCQEEVLSGITVTAQEQVNAARRCADSCGRRRGAELKKKKETNKRTIRSNQAQMAQVESDKVARPLFGTIGISFAFVCRFRETWQEKVAVAAF